MKNPPVASLTLSKELAEYVILDTYFYWFNRVKVHEDVGEWHYDACDYTLVDYLKIKQFIIDKKRAPDMIENCEKTNLIPAPLSDELGVVLPHRLGKYYLEIHKKEPYIEALYMKNVNEESRYNIQGPCNNLAETLGRMLLYLYKNELIERE